MRTFTFDVCLVHHDSSPMTERYGWYVAGPELANEIGRRLAQLIDEAGLDMVCFDGADVSADPETGYSGTHKVPLGIFRHAHRDVLIISNGSSITNGT